MIDLSALTDDEIAALVDAARRAYRADRFPLAPRLRPLREALAKIDAMAGAAPVNPVSAPLDGGPAVAIRRRKTRR